jgi:DNA-binding NarL/FixJ family response regulator
MPIRTAIIEDNASFASTIDQHFKRPGSEVLCVAVYGTAEAALAELPAAVPQVALVDINLPGMSGIECIARLRELCPDLLCIVLTTFEEDALIFEALKAGACGYLLKRSSPDELTEAIKQAVSGGAPMSPQIARQVVSFFHTRPPRKDGTTLSPREREIIDLLASGFLYKEIAEKLDLKFETVRSYVKKIYEKLHAHSRTDAILKWQGKGKSSGPGLR